MKYDHIVKVAFQWIENLSERKRIEISSRIPKAAGLGQRGLARRRISSAVSLTSVALPVCSFHVNIQSRGYRLSCALSLHNSHRRAAPVANTASLFSFLKYAYGFSRERPNLARFIAADVFGLPSPFSSSKKKINERERKSVLSEKLSESRTQIHRLDGPKLILCEAIIATQLLTAAI